jgi:hypothetical protein
VLRDMTEHPVFRWAPVDGDAAIAVAVGSDDPGVFATELAFEIAVLAAALKKKRVPDTKLRLWLERTSPMGDDRPYWAG